MADDIWAHRDRALHDEDLIGFAVETTDGVAGTVQAAAYDSEHNYLVVLTDEARTVVLPAGTVTGADIDDEVVRVDCDRHMLVTAPEYEADREGDPDYIEVVGAYWGDTAEGVA
jgi:hypothetical protein